MGLANEMRQTLLASRRNYAELLATTAELVLAQEASLDAVSQTLVRLPPRAWTLSQMRRQFETFTVARSHFRTIYGIKASSWQVLIDRVNTVETALLCLGVASRSLTDEPA